MADEASAPHLRSRVCHKLLYSLQMEREASWNAASPLTYDGYNNFKICETYIWQILQIDWKYEYLGPVLCKHVENIF